MGNRLSSTFILFCVGFGCGSHPPAVPETPIAVMPAGGDLYSPKAAAPTPTPPPAVTTPPPPPPVASSAPPMPSASVKPAPSAKPKGK